MSHPVWPYQLKRFERESWQKQRAEARLKRQSDAGPPGYRRRFSAVPAFVSLALRVSDHERDLFDYFYERSTAFGSKLFWMPDPSVDGWPTRTSTGEPIIAGDGKPLPRRSTWLCMFGDTPPAETLVGYEFRKAFSVVVMP